MRADRVHHLRGNISNTRKSVSSDIQTLRSGLKKRGAAEFFQPTSKWISDETLSRVFDITSQNIIIHREIQGKSSPNFMIIRITYPTLIDGNDFLCFLFMNY